MKIYRICRIVLLFMVLSCTNGIAQQVIFPIDLLQQNSNINLTGWTDPKTFPLDLSNIVGDSLTVEILLKENTIADTAYADTLRAVKLRIRIANTTLNIGVENTDVYNGSSSRLWDTVIPNHSVQDTIISYTIPRGFSDRIMFELDYFGETDSVKTARDSSFFAARNVTVNINIKGQRIKSVIQIQL